MMGQKWYQRKPDEYREDFYLLIMNNYTQDEVEFLRRAATNIEGALRIGQLLQLDGTIIDVDVVPQPSPEDEVRSRLEQLRDHLRRTRSEWEGKGPFPPGSFSA